jgi:hypothetical protein
MNWQGQRLNIIPGSVTEFAIGDKKRKQKNQSSGEGQRDRGED